MNVCHRVLGAAMLAMVLAGIAGCGSDPKVRVAGTTSISKGTELIDLQAALAAGAVDQAEYDALRAVILKRPN